MRNQFGLDTFQCVGAIEVEGAYWRGVPWQQTIIQREMLIRK